MKTKKKIRQLGCLFGLGGLIAPFVLAFIILGVTSTQTVDDGDCPITVSSTASGHSTSSVYASISDFVQEHEEAYLLSWKIGGFLPSASITQTMIENGFNFTNPDGTSFWKAHNMGGVKTSKRSDFVGTIELYGEDSVDLTGTKEGTNVGDGTGGNYVWFKDYSAGIVGKAEFMKNQSLYTGAINNIDGISTLQAIAAGGWASDPEDYRIKLTEQYMTLGEQFKWLDEKAISKYGSSPVSDVSPTGVSSTSDSYKEDDSKVKVDVDTWELIVVNRDSMKTDSDFSDVNFVSVFTNNNRTDITVDSRIKEKTEEFLQKAMSEIDSNFQIVSGYRSYSLQESIYNSYIQEEMINKGVSREEATKIVQTYSQPAGASEHMTGLAIDITNTGVFNSMSKDVITKLETIGAEFGFIRHFKEEYKSSTGIGEEDWHFRYVGKEHAQKIVEMNISLEDYVSKGMIASNLSDRCGSSGLKTSGLGAGDFGAIFDTAYTVTQAYGNAWAIYSGGSHTGVDLVPLGDSRVDIPVYAVSDGKVLKSGDANDGYGNSVQHTTPDGRSVLYAHFRYTPLVKVGEEVKKGDQIGVMGSTGMSTGDHVHFEVLTDQFYGKRVDPSYVLIENGSVTAGMVIEPRKN